MSEQARRQLAAAQTVVRALLAGGPAPAGFDPERLGIEATALLAKRRRVIQQIRPDLVDALGTRYTELFDTWAKEHPRRDRTSARTDADQFAAWLAGRGHLPKQRRWRRH